MTKGNMTKGITVYRSHWVPIKSYLNILKENISQRKN